MKDLMIDIETLDKQASAVVVQVGWVPFSPTEIGKPHEMVMNIQEQIDLGRTISADTIAWWMEQPDIARHKVFCDPDRHTIDEVASRLRTVIGSMEAERVWAHGPHFDIAILKDLFGDGVFHYRSPRDTRTLADLAPAAEKPAALTKHSAGDDAYAQAQWIQNCWREIGWPS